MTFLSGLIRVFAVCSVYKHKRTQILFIQTGKTDQTWQMPRLILVNLGIMTMTMNLFQLRAHEGQKIIGEILHTMIEHN